MWFPVVAAAVLVGGAVAQRADSENVLGHTLGKCDRPAYFEAHPEQRDTRYPTTGYFRNNECTASSGDAGAHFVCVTMPNATTNTGDTYSTFWVETRMFAQHPTFIDMLECDATNRWVVENYALENDAQGRALAAVCGKCAVATASLETALRDKCAAAVGKYPEIGALGEQSAGRRQLEDGADGDVEKYCDPAAPAAHGAESCRPIEAVGHGAGR
jgi:hypothetical protein